MMLVSVPMVHEQVHQRAAQEEQVGQKRQETAEMAPMLGDEPEGQGRRQGQDGHLN
jgi:hypothetical protein